MKFDHIPDLLGQVVAQQQETNRLLQALIPNPNVLDTGVEYLKQKAVVAEPDPPAAVTEAAPKKAKKTPKVDRDTVRQKLTEFIASNGRDQGIAILTSFNAGKLSDLADAQLEQFNDALEGATV